VREDEIKLQEHFQLLYRHRYLIIIAFVLVFLPVIFMVSKEMARYRSSVTFAVRNESIAEEIVQNIDVGVDLTIANQLDILKSTNFLGRVYDALPPSYRSFDKIEKPSITAKGIRYIKKLMGMAVVELSPRAEGIMDLEARSSVDHRGGDVIKVSVISANPKKAQVIANTYADQFIKVNLEAMQRQISSLNDFFKEQIEKSYTKLKKAEDELENFKQTRGIFSVKGQTSQLAMRMHSIENQYIEIKTQRELAERRLQLLEERLQEIRKDYPDISDLENNLPRIEDLKTRLTELEQEKMSASAIYTDKHPKIVSIKKEIEETVRQLRDLTKRQGGEKVPILDWQNLFVEKLLSEVEISSLKSKEYSYKALLDDYKKKLLYELPEKERGLFQLLKEVELARQMYQSLLNNHERLQMVAAENVGNITILEPAIEPVAPIPSRRMLKLIFGVMLGISVGVGLAYLAELLNITLRTVEEVERKIQLPVLGTILDITPYISKSNRWGKKAERKRSLYGLISYRSPESVVAENFKTLSANLSFKLNGNGKGHALLVTSPGPSEGKSTVASNLALTLAQSGKSTILLDADLRRPMQHKIFGLPTDAGLSDILMNGTSMSEINRPNTNKLALDVMTCGRETKHPAELLASRKLASLIERLKSQYDYVLIDAPPILTVADAMSISRRVAGVVLVFQSGKTHTEAARRSRDLLKNINANILGVVLNKLNVRNQYGPYSYYEKYYYSYGDKKRKSR